MFHRRPLDTIWHRLPIRHVSFKRRKQSMKDTRKIESGPRSPPPPAFLAHFPFCTPMPPRSPARALRTATCGLPRPRSAQRSSAKPRARREGQGRAALGARGNPQSGFGAPRKERGEKGVGERAEPERAGRL